MVRQNKRSVVSKRLNQSEEQVGDKVIRKMARADPRSTAAKPKKKPKKVMR